LIADNHEPFRLARRILVIILLAAAALHAQKVTISVLATTDMHGNLYPIDYFTDEPAARGLAKMATLIREARAANPNSLLVDCGDTIQGSPMESVYQKYAQSGQFPLGLSLAGERLTHDPMMLAMNRIGYDMMTVGNHEFNFGLKNFNRARDGAKFPWIAANIETTPGSTQKPFAPYLVKNVAGVKVAVIGITTPSVPQWEKPENYAGYRFLPGVGALKKAMAELRRAEHPDLVLAAVHAGLDRNPRTHISTLSQLPGENMVYDLAREVPEIDAIVFGHTHSELVNYRVGKVLLVQPKNWAISLARLDFDMQKAADGHWAVARKDSRLIPVKESTPADEEVLALGKPYHEITERYLNSPVAESAKALNSALGRVEDTALMDAIQEVQLYYSQADVSFASLFNHRVNVPQGPVTVRQIAALYVYDNELYAIEGTGKMVKEALENAAQYFVSCQAEACGKGPLTNPRVIPFNFDMAQGVQYEIDLTRREGDRIRNLMWKGKPLAPEQKLRIAVNNYRSAGSAGYKMFAGAKILWQSRTEIRELMIQYYTERKHLPVDPDNNWRIVPDEARRTLEREAMEEAKRAKLM
jgi:2',3'-cyclic-nucleotide 2'-phosphodiesterase/3'-nucleotidase